MFFCALSHILCFKFLVSFKFRSEVIQTMGETGMLTYAFRLHVAHKTRFHLISGFLPDLKEKNIRIVTAQSNQFLPTLTINKRFCFLIKTSDLGHVCDIMENLNRIILCKHTDTYGE